MGYNLSSCHDQRSVACGAAIPTSTTRPDTLACVEYMERVPDVGERVLGLQIPLPGEANL